MALGQVLEDDENLPLDDGLAADEAATELAR
jgi:hypothetical protein